MIGELRPAAFHNIVRYTNDRVECDHGRLKAGSYPRAEADRGTRRDHSRSAFRIAPRIAGTTNSASMPETVISRSQQHTTNWSKPPIGRRNQPEGGNSNGAV